MYVQNEFTHILNRKRFGERNVRKRSACEYINLDDGIYTSTSASESGFTRRLNSRLAVVK